MRQCSQHLASSLLLAAWFGAAEVNLRLTAARLLLVECPDLQDQPDEVVDLWHSFAAAVLGAQAGTYVDPRSSLDVQLHLLSSFVTSYPVAVLHLCPGSLMRYFKKAGDAALAAGDLQRCRYLLQWGTTYRLMAVARWYNRMTSSPSWNKDTLPPAALSFDPEYQAVYDLALQELHTKFSVRPRYLTASVPQQGVLHSRVHVLAVCLYQSDAALPALAEGNHRRYCQHRGYSYELMSIVPQGGWERIDTLRLPREPHYWKVQRTLETLERKDGPDWVLVIDCDAFFTNVSVGVLDIVATYGSSANFFVAEEPAGINTGVLLFRRHAWTLAFLHRVLATPFVQIWDQSQYLWQLFDAYRVMAGSQSLEGAEEAGGGGVGGGGRVNGSGGPGSTSKVVVGPPPQVAPVHQSHLNAYHSGTADSWNAYAWRPGDFVIHYAGCPWDEALCFAKMQISAHVIEEQLLSE